MRRNQDGLHSTFRATEEDLTLSCPQTAQWYRPVSSLLAEKNTFITGCPSLNQTTFTGVSQPDTQVSLTTVPSTTELCRTEAVSSESQEKG